MTDTKKNHWNARIVANRNPSWREKMMAGKQSHAEHPSKLRLARLADGKSQLEIATASGLSVTTYGDIERGKRTVRKETSELIAKILNCSRERLFIRDKGSRYIVLKKEEK
jgi:DNA-binding XRE family transcriptional regulator